MPDSSKVFKDELAEAQAAAEQEADWTEAGAEIQSQWSSWSSAYPKPSKNS